MKSAKILILALLFFSSVNADNEVFVLRNLLSTYKKWKPRGILDIGANKGAWTTKVLETLLPNVKTFMIEASPEHTAELEQVQNKFGKDVVDFKIALMSANDGDTVQFWGFGGTGDSMFQETTKFYSDQKPILRETSKLDTLVKHMEFIDYIKIDVQGAELLVLAGASETLAKATFIQLEVSVVEYNQGGACWYEMDDMLRKHGFFFYDSGDYSRNKSSLFKTLALGQFDVLYIKPTSTYLPDDMKKDVPSFCGSSRNTVTPDAQTAKLESSSTTQIRKRTIHADSTMSSSEGWNNHLIVMGYLVTFLMGYLAAKMRFKSKHVGKTL